MSLVISKVFTYDTDAGDYIQRVEGASGDNQALEPATRQAINNFVIGCKQDGIWNAIKASCILSGARTLNGALQPLVGTAPTNFNFVSGDYNRKTGLVGSNLNSKRLDSNRNNTADPQNSQHLAVFKTQHASSNLVKFIGGGNSAIQYNSAGPDVTAYSRSSSINFGPYVVSGLTGFFGKSRSNSSEFTFRVNNLQILLARASSSPTSSSITIYGPESNSGRYADDRLAFYSIGESIDLALLDARVTALITAFGVAIP